MAGLGHLAAVVVLAVVAGLHARSNTWIQQRGEEAVALTSPLAHKLTLGTYLAVERGPDPSLPPSFALLSVWDATRSLRLRVGGAAPLLRASLAAARALDQHAPWLRVPSLPDVFRPFGTYLLYGLRMSGPEGPALLRSLCRHAHNVARKNPACAVVAADLGPDDPAAAAVSTTFFFTSTTPHSRPELVTRESRRTSSR